MSEHYLTSLLAPKSVAIVGASSREGALGGFVWQNMLRAKYQGTLFAVNPRYTEIYGAPCYASLADLPSVPELIVVATPAKTVIDIIRDAGAKGVRHVGVVRGISGKR